VTGVRGRPWTCDSPLAVDDEESEEQTEEAVTRSGEWERRRPRWGLAPWENQRTALQRSWGQVKEDIADSQERWQVAEEKAVDSADDEKRRGKGEELRRRLHHPTFTTAASYEGEA
jgi:hypothetical protein